MKTEFRIEPVGPKGYENIRFAFFEVTIDDSGHEDLRRMFVTTDGGPHALRDCVDIALALESTGGLKYNGECLNEIERHNEANALADAAIYDMQSDREALEEE